MRRILMILCALTACIAAGGQTETAMDIYLCIGQSNMAGRGKLDSTYTDTIPNVYLLGPEGDMEPACNPLNKYSTIRKDIKMQGIGPAYSFSVEMALRTGRKIGLVVNARGGTGISSWQKGAEAGYYEQAILRLRQALRYGKLKAVIWHQGESDLAHPDTYMSKLQKLVADLRQDLGDETVPFVIGEIARWRPDGSADPFNAMLRTVDHVIPFSACVSSEGLLPLRDERDPHFDAASQVVLGKRYAEAVLDLLSRD